MKNFTLCICLAILFGFNSFSTQAQDRCGMEAYMEEMMQEAIGRYAQEVRDRKFPASEHLYKPK